MDSAGFPVILQSRVECMRSWWAAVVGPLYQAGNGWVGGRKVRPLMRGVGCGVEFARSWGVS